MSVSGAQAEEQAAQYLSEKRFDILGRNWKNRWCEIDIVAKKGERIHFIEVKYRKNPAYGSGLDFITRKKSRQMEFAALQWVSEHEWEGDYQLDVIAVSGEDNPQIEYVPNAIPF